MDDCNGCACHSNPPCSHCVDHVDECRHCGNLFASCDPKPCRSRKTVGADCEAEA